MRPPIFVSENGDTQIFETVAEAEAYMEPVDVENGEYLVCDADGRRLKVEVEFREVELLFGLYKRRVRGARISEVSDGFQ